MSKTKHIPEAIRAALSAEHGRAAREISFERAVVNADTRTAELAFASETPYERYWGIEILNCEQASVRTTRLANGCNLIVDHDHRDVVGVVESFSFGADRKLRAVVRFGKSARAQEIFDDVADGIRTNVSVGYLIHKAILESETDGVGTYRVTDWEPYELTLTSVPADTAVGVGRAMDATAEDGSYAPPETNTETETEDAGASDAEDSTATEATTTTVTIEVTAMTTTTERNHAAEISAIGAQMGLQDLALKSIQAGHSVEQFQAEALKATATRAIATDVDLSTKEVKQYSYVRALACALARAEGQAISGLEAEISQDMERAMPSSYKRNGGIFVPLSLQRGAISEALYNTSGKGASTVFTQPGDFIELLRNASISVGLGARVMTGLTGPVSFPSQTAGASAYWVTENSGTNVTASNATLSSVGLTPKTLQGTTAFSRQLMAQSSIDVESFIRADLAAAHALAWDLAVLHGSGNSGEPQGIYAASGVNAVAMGGVPSFGKIIDMVTEVLKDNALAGSLAFATTPGMAGKLAQTVVAATTDTRMIWSGALDNGNLGGYRAVSSNQVSATLGGGSEHGMIFGNWNDVMIGNFGGLELVVDPYSLKKQGMVEVTSFQLCDIALRHAASFCKATGATIA